MERPNPAHMPSSLVVKNGSEARRSVASCDRSEAQISRSPALVAPLHRTRRRIRATRKSGSYDLAYSARPRAITSSIRPAEGLLIRCHCSSLGNADTRNSVPRAEFASRNPWFLKLAERRLDPRGLLSPYLYAGTVRPLY